MEGFAQALARRASDHKKLLARPRKLLVPDDRTGLLSSPEDILYEKGKLGDTTNLVVGREI